MNLFWWWQRDGQPSSNCPAPAACRPAKCSSTDCRKLTGQQHHSYHKNCGLGSWKHHPHRRKHSPHGSNCKHLQRRCGWQCCRRWCRNRPRHCQRWCRSCPPSYLCGNSCDGQSSRFDQLLNKSGDNNLQQRMQTLTIKFDMKPCGIVIYTT